MSKKEEEAFKTCPTCPTKRECMKAKACRNPMKGKKGKPGMYGYDKSKK